MHKIVAVLFSFNGEELTIVAWDDKGEKVEISFPVIYLLDFFDGIAENAEKS